MPDCRCGFMVPPHGEHWHTCPLYVPPLSHEELLEVRALIRKHRTTDNLNLSTVDTDVGGPGGQCEECGHFAGRHHGLQCYFPPESPVCPCTGMLWCGKRYEMDFRTGPVRGVAG